MGEIGKRFLSLIKLPQGGPWHTLAGQLAQEALKWTLVRHVEVRTWCSDIGMHTEAARVTRCSKAFRVEDAVDLTRVSTQFTRFYAVARAPRIS